MSDSDTSTEAKNKNGDEKRDSVTPIPKRRKPVDIAIQAVTLLGLILGIGVAAVSVYDWKHKGSFILWLSYSAVVVALLAFALFLQKRIWEKADEATSVQNVAKQPREKERPYVFAKITNLVEPEVGKEAVLQVVLVNSGQMEAVGTARDVTYVFEVPPFKDTHEYGSSETNSFSLVPTAEITLYLRFPMVWTQERINALNSGQARFFIFARINYQDPLGRDYPLPFCRMYDKDVAGKTIICPDQITIK